MDFGGLATMGSMDGRDLADLGATDRCVVRFDQGHGRTVVLPFYRVLPFSSKFYCSMSRQVERPKKKEHTHSHTLLSYYLKLKFLVSVRYRLSIRYSRFDCGDSAMAMAMARSYGYTDQTKRYYYYYCCCYYYYSEPLTIYNATVTVTVYNLFIDNFDNLSITRL